MPISNRSNGHEDTSAAGSVMNTRSTLGSAAPLGALRQFARKRAPAPAPLEYCELCSATLAPEHRHLLELSNRTVTCACDACSILFGAEGASEGKYRAIPRRYSGVIRFSDDGCAMG